MLTIQVGNGILFWKKSSGIDSDRFPLFRGRKCSFRGMPRSTEESIPKLGTEIRKKIVFWNSKNNLTKWFVRTSKVLNASKWNFESLLVFLFHRIEFRVLFSSAEGFGTESWEFASIFVIPNGIPSIFLFRGIPRVCFYFCCTVQSSKHFFFHEMVWNGIPRDFCSTEQSEFRRNSATNQNCFVYSVFREIFFLSEIANPTYSTEIYLRLFLLGRTFWWIFSWHIFIPNSVFQRTRFRIHLYAAPFKGTVAWDGFLA